MARTRWTRNLLVGAGILVAQLGMARVAHSQSAGSIGVRVQVTTLEPARAAWQTVAEQLELHQAADGVRQARQPSADRPVLVVVDRPGETARARSAEPAPRTRVSIIYP